MKDYKHIEHMRNLNDSLIWERMKRCYDYGYEDGQKEKLANAMIHDHEVAEKKAYNRGLNDAWEVIKKITKDDSVGGYSIEMMQELFGRTCVYDITHNYTPEEAIAKIREYENKQKQDDWRDIPSDKMTLEQARRAVKELRAEVVGKILAEGD